MCIWFNCRTDRQPPGIRNMKIIHGARFYSKNVKRNYEWHEKYANQTTRMVIPIMLYNHWINVVVFYLHTPSFSFSPFPLSLSLADYCSLSLDLFDFLSSLLCINLMKRKTLAMTWIKHQTMRDWNWICLLWIFGFRIRLIIMTMRRVHGDRVKMKLSTVYIHFPNGLKAIPTSSED